MTDRTKIDRQVEEARLRRCLLCGELFASDGPHNRICRKCKSSQVWRQG